MFDIPGRELIVVAGPLVDPSVAPRQIAVLLKRPDGEQLEAMASIAFPLQTPPPKEHRFLVTLAEIIYPFSAGAGGSFEVRP